MHIHKYANRQTIIPAIKYICIFLNMLKTLIWGNKTTSITFLWARKECLAVFRTYLSRTRAYLLKCPTQNMSD